MVFALNLVKFDQLHETLQIRKIEVIHETSPFLFKFVVKDSKAT